MYALFDALTGESSPPIYVIVEGGLYLVLTDFRHWARVESTILDSEITDRQKETFLLSSFLPAIGAGQISLQTGYPFPIEAGLRSLMDFYSCGDDKPDDEKDKEEKPKPEEKHTERIYDFRHDIALIYASFRSAYGLDLSRESSMHWWLFRALFDGLPPESSIKTLMRARSEKLPEKPTAAQVKAKEAIALPESIRYFSRDDRKPKTQQEWSERIRAKRAQANQTG